MKTFLLFLLNFLLSFPKDGERVRSKNYLILIAPHEFSESEFRALEKNLKDGSLTIAALDTTPCLGDSAMLIKPHITLSQIDTLKYDILILIGGPGILFYDNEKILIPILNHFANKGLVGLGISSLLLARFGILKDRPATTIPDQLAIKELKSHSVIYRDKPVVKTGKILTAPSVNKKLLSELFRL
ncbi:MAG: DJ-1/PfpI family protein [candidate division WOR-3 bacterium]